MDFTWLMWIYTLQILKLFLLFVWRTNGTVIFFISDSQKLQSKCQLLFFFSFFCSDNVASYFKHELPSLANSRDQLCLRSPPTQPVGWCTGQWHQYFWLILGCAHMLKEEALQDTSVPLSGLFPSLSASPACTSGHRWRCLAVQEFKPEQSLPCCSGGKAWVKRHLIWLSDWQQDHAVHSADPIIWKRRTLKKRNSN